MTSHTVFFHHIAVDMPRTEIYRRLGFRKDTTHLSASRQRETEASMEYAESLIRLQGVLRRVPIRARQSSEIALPDGTTFESRKLSAFLRGCEEIVLMGATAGNDIMDAIHADASGDRITRGVVLDAVASETVDRALDWIMAYVTRSLRRENKTLLKGRFSAGYGDLLLENQRTMYRLLEMDRIGVSITESCILVPEKSVTAITGIKTA